MSEKNTRKRRVTMADVAAEAKVGQATVSFVMNGRDDMRVSASTSKRVIEVAKRLGYRPRSLGRPPKDVANEVIGLLWPPLLHRPW